MTSPTNQSAMYAGSNNSSTITVNLSTVSYQPAAPTRAPSNSILSDTTNAFRAYVSPVVAIVGILGNTLVVLAFMSERQKSRFSIYCIALALVHTVALVMNSLLDDFLGRGLIYATNHRIMITKLDVISDDMCRFMEYVPNVMYFASSHLLLIFTLDRILTIYNPLRFYSIYYKRIAVAISCGIVVVGFLANTPILLVYQLVNDSRHGVQNGHKCDQGNSMEDLAILGIRIKVIGAFIVPTLTVLLCNCLICVKLWRIMHTRVKLLPSDFKGNTQEMNRVAGHLALSTAFLLLTLPLVVVMILRQHSDTNRLSRTYPDYVNAIKHLSRLFSSVKDIAYAADFFLYFTFLTNFRWRVLRLLFSPCIATDCFRASRFGASVLRKVATFDSNTRRRPSTISALCNNLHRANKVLRTNTICGGGGIAQPTTEV